MQTQAHPTITPLFYCKNILPIGLFMALTLHFGNVVYLYLTMSFIQILKVGMAASRGLLSCPVGENVHLCLTLTFIHNMKVPGGDVRLTAA